MFGLTRADIAEVETPKEREMPWGLLTPCAAHAEHYRMERLDLEGTIPLHFYLEREGSYFLERGEVFLRTVDQKGSSSFEKMQPGSIFSFSPGQLHALQGSGVLYLFSNDVPFEEARFAENYSENFPEAPLTGATTFDVREKYWGKIESIVAGAFAGKRIFMRKGGQSSLEFHRHKVESYFVQSGLLKVGLRFGRAENGSSVLESGQSFTIYPGQMHMRIALEETVIFEVSTRDDDRDSHLVEDGTTYEHKE
jgi:mannose-6-phosphate isomerase-like protein (cupin superfamily)